mgnify:CR=1 FL=1
MRYQLITTEGRAKRAEVQTVHGTIQTPVFMNVGTAAAIKGAVSTDDLRQIGTQIELLIPIICMSEPETRRSDSSGDCIDL